MLNRIIKKHQPALIMCSKYLGSDHHGPVQVKIDRDAKWIRYRTSRKMMCVDGMKDINIPTPALLDMDPFAHLHNKSFFDGQSFFYSDPFHHSIDHQLHATEPQGYLLSDQPNDTRFDLVIPVFAAAASLVLLGSWYLYSDLNLVATPEQMVVEAITVEERASQILERKSQRVRQLEEQLASLKSSKQ